MVVDAGPASGRSAGARRAIGTTVALALVAGCVASGQPTPPSGDALVATGSNGPIRITLMLEGPPRNDTASWASVLIENVADRGVRWAGGGCGDPGETSIDARGSFPVGRSDWPGRLGAFKRLATGWSDPRGAEASTARYVDASRFGNDTIACAGDLRIETLAVGASVRYRAGWDGTLNGIRAPAGPASVTASFPFVGLAGLVAPNITESTPVTATVRTTISGLPGVAGLAPTLAIDAALADPRFAAFVQAADPTTWVNPEVVLTDGLWGVGLFRYAPDGATILFAEVKVDAMGNVLGWRSEP